MRETGRVTHRYCRWRPCYRPDPYRHDASVSRSFRREGKAPPCVVTVCAAAPSASPRAPVPTSPCPHVCTSPRPHGASRPHLTLPAALTLCWEACGSHRLGLCVPGTTISCRFPGNPVRTGKDIFPPGSSPCSCIFRSALGGRTYRAAGEFLEAVPAPDC